MERSKKNSFCCGGGGGRMWADFSEEKRMSDIRAQEAAEAGAEVLATSCPWCTINLEDAIKTLDLEGRLQVKDITELLAEAI
jgi:Fe-S oxidoreductase